LPKLGLSNSKKNIDTKIPKLLATNHSISLPKLNQALKEKKEFVHQSGFKGINMDTFDQSLIKAKSHRYGSLKQESTEEEPTKPKYLSKSVKKPSKVKVESKPEKPQRKSSER